MTAEAALHPYQRSSLANITTLRGDMRSNLTEPYRRENQRFEEKNGLQVKRNWPNQWRLLLRPRIDVRVAFWGEERESREKADSSVKAKSRPYGRL